MKITFFKTVVFWKCSNTYDIYCSFLHSFHFQFSQRVSVIFSCHSYGWQLGKNFPSLFNPTTAISCHLSVKSQFELTIYDVSGKRIGTLVNKFQSAGNHMVNWDASHVSSGIYFYRLQAGGLANTKKWY